MCSIKKWPAPLTPSARPFWHKWCCCSSSQVITPTIGKTHSKHRERNFLFTQLKQISSYEKLASGKIAFTAKIKKSKEFGWQQNPLIHHRNSFFSFKTWNNLTTTHTHTHWWPAISISQTFALSWVMQKEEKELNQENFVLIPFDVCFVKFRN